MLISVYKHSLTAIKINRAIAWSTVIAPMALSPWSGKLLRHLNALTINPKEETQTWRDRHYYQ
jgi:hypothetical protein